MTGFIILQSGPSGPQPDVIVYASGVTLQLSPQRVIASTTTPVASTALITATPNCEPVVEVDATVLGGT